MKRIDLCPLSVNQAYTGKRFNTPKKTKFMEDLRLLLEGCELVDAVAPYEVHYVFYIDKRQDIDGCIKVAQDVICDFFWINDNQIYKIIAEKIVSKEHYFLFDIHSYTFSSK